MSDHDYYGAITPGSIIFGPADRPDYRVSPDYRLHTRFLEARDLAHYVYVDGRRKPMTGASASPETLDLAVWPIFARMTERGLRLDVGKMEGLRAEVQDELDAQLALLEVYAGRALNPFSPDDVAAWMAREGFTKGRRTKGKRRLATDERTLALLKGAHPVPECVLECRGLRKLIGTFIDPVLTIAARDGGVVHPRWRLTTVKSGRPSCEDPNLLAFPTRDAWGKRVRECFVARQGFKLVSVDFSQIEPRVAAALSQDPALLAVYERGLDVYGDMARRLFKISEGDKELKNDPELSRRYRQPAKKVLLGCVLYGMEAERLYDELIREGCGTPSAPLYDEAACEDFVRRRFEPYPLVGVLAAETVRQAVMRDGWAYTHGGRGRFLPALLLDGRGWPQAKLREEAQRQAFNHLIQGTAQEIMKLAMLRAGESPAALYPLLQVYDEMVYEVAETKADAGASTLAAVMATRFEGVEIAANWSVSDTWGGLK